MSAINNDQEFRDAIDKLDAVQQRVVGSEFVRNVWDLTKDERVRRAVGVACDVDADTAQIAVAIRAAKAAALEAHARCGADGEWRDQAGYFVARAAEACLAPNVRSEARPPAWRAAMSSRMARTALAEENGDDTHDRESEHQYRILSDFLNSLKDTGP